MSADLEMALRWANVILGFLGCAAIVAWAALGSRGRGKSETLGLFGSALLCFAVALGSLGVIFGFESIYRLPMITVALAYVLVGRVAQMIIYRHHERQRHQQGPTEGNPS